MDVRCYICNTNAPGQYTNDLTNLRLMYSKRSIANLLKELLGGFESLRCIDDQTNCICTKCLKSISDYDLAYSNVMSKQQYLRNLLWKTEKWYKHLHLLIKDSPRGSVESLDKIEVDTDDNAENDFDEEKYQVEEKTTADPPFSGEEDSSDSDSPDAEESEEVEEEEEEEKEDVKESTLETTTNYSAEIKGPPYECKRCDTFIRCNNEEEFREHLIWHDEHECNICGRVFQRKRDKAIHQNRECHYCKIEFDRISKYKNHMRQHQKNAEFQCITCHYVLDDQTTYYDHIQLHKKKPKGHCVLCDKRFKREKLLQMHMRVHNENSYLCDMCGKGFKYRESLRLHRSTHDDARSEKCSICSKTFKTKPQLKRHIRNHDDTRPYACQFCDMKFKRKGHCTVHEKRHKEDTKTEKCTLCAAAFEHKHHLKQHLQRKHGTELLHEKIKTK